MNRRKLKVKRILCEYPNPKYDLDIFMPYTAAAAAVAMHHDDEISVNSSCKSAASSGQQPVGSAKGRKFTIVRDFKFRNNPKYIHSDFLHMKFANVSHARRMNGPFNLICYLCRATGICLLDIRLINHLVKL